MHNRRCVMSQPRYFKVDACQDCALCKKDKNKKENEDLISSPRLPSVVRGDILSFTVCWNIIFLQSPTESPDRVTRRQTAQQRNSIFPPRIVWDWVLCVFNKAWRGNQIVGRKKRKNKQPRDRKKREKPTLASSSDPHLMDSHHAHQCVTELRFEQKNRLPTLKRTVLTTRQRLWIITILLADKGRCAVVLNTTYSAEDWPIW